jgi:multidrug transporter EmrE-like cation transporter
MSLPEIFALSVIEIIGDFGIKEYANNKGWPYLATGIVGYIGVVVTLIVSLQDSTILMVNNAWDGTSSLIESLFAYVVLGERFESWTQYLGIALIFVGLFLLKIPWSKAHPFYIPRL